MTQPERGEPRSRDDSQLRRLVEEARSWMEQQGVQERPLDLEALAKEERWRERLEALAERAGEFPAAVAAALRRLGEAAEAVVEVSLDRAQQVGRVLFDQALGGLAAGPVSFAHAAATRAKGGQGLGQDESVGIVVTPGLMPGVRVEADAATGTVTVEVLDAQAAPVVVLVPEDPSEQPRAVQAGLVRDVAEARFERVPQGRYLLAIQPGEVAP